MIIFQPGLNDFRGTANKTAVMICAYGLRHAEAPKSKILKKFLSSEPKYF